MVADSIHSNKGLFSDHYLDEILPTPEEKRWSSDINLGIAFDKIRELYAEKETDLPKLNESQLEQFFIQPVLEILGHHTIVQPSERTSEGIKRPDYALFDSEDARNEALGYINEDWKLFTRAAGLCEAKKWDRKLDVSLLDQPTLFESRNPAYQMQHYLYHSEVKWGILTNGRVWRLYEREQSKRLDRYYQVDLIELIGPEGSLFGKGMTRLDRLEAFKYFYLFFRRQAFPEFLDYVLAGSRDYAQAVGAELKDNVYKALRLLAQGFVDYTGNELEPEKDKEMIRENCFVLLYRLLFVLFAESKHLLPVSDSPDYKRNYSLHHLKEEVTIKLRDALKYSKKTFTLWAKLESLFTLINVGEDAYRIPPYNGGLFNNDLHGFFNKYKVADWYLAEIINLLCTAKAEGKDKQGKRLEFIDYSSLEVRDLGSIYEGLLENRLQIAAEPMVAVRKGKRERWKPLRERKEEEKSKTTASVDKGQYYPVTERGERKATGSYYTPDYIVEYIVEHTLGPLVCKCKTEAELLLLRVLDPAIGSGHFLVEATDFLARQLLGIKEVEETADEVGKAKRLIIERCIFGVDKNPLAVELAKLSLWLHTVARDKPLSFLDHHLRCGDSLVGAKVAELGTLPGEKPKPLFQMIVEHYSAETIGFYRQIEEMPSDTLDQIHDKTRLLETARTQMLPFRRAADVWISTYFGNEVKPADYSRVIEALRSGKEDSMAQFEGEEWFTKADELWGEHRFFHWELEFAEVFFDKQGRSLENPGFDAVIGNPPYVRQEVLGEVFKNYAKSKYEAYAGTADLYVYFIEQAHRLLRVKGNFGMITSNKFIRTNYGQALRKFLVTESKLFQMIDFGELPVFPEAATFPLVILTQNKATKKQSFLFAPVKRLDFEDLKKEVAEIGIKLDNRSISGGNWTLASQKEVDIFQKMRQSAETFNEYVKGEIYRGVLTGFNKAFIIDRKTRDQLIAQDPKSADVIKPLIVGNDVRKYTIDFKEKYLIFTRRNIDIRQYPAIKEYLSTYKMQLTPRPKDWDVDRDGIWDGRKPGCYKWFEIQDITKYYANFDKPKIIWPDIAKESRFAIDSEGLYVEATAFIVPLGDLYLLSLLNSKLLWFFLRMATPVLGDVDKGGRIRIKQIYVEQLPIRTIDFSKQKDKKMHDDMVNLVQTMLKAHKRKQVIEANYTGWLAHLVGAQLEELTGRSKIGNLNGLADINQLAELLKKNRKKTHFDTEDDMQYTKLHKGFERFKGKLEPVVAEIEQTDKAIDELVYKLYGLTPEEIEIVEGRGNPLP